MNVLIFCISLIKLSDCVWFASSVFVTWGQVSNMAFVGNFLLHLLVPAGLVPSELGASLTAFLLAPLARI